jgi:hypothetical protein
MWVAPGSRLGPYEILAPPLRELHDVETKRRRTFSSLGRATVSVS